jgi:hypothetical protein
MTPWQETAALRDFNRAYLSLGSSTTEAGKATRMHFRFAPRATAAH